MAPSPVVLPPPAFYQAVASIFAVLLLSGVVTETRALGDVGKQDRPLSGRELAQLMLFALLSLMLLLGEVVTLDVLVHPPVRSWQHRIITGALLLGLIVVPVMTFVQVWPRLPRRARWPAVAGGVCVLALTLVTVMRLADSSGQFGLGAWNVPKLVATRIYGTCAEGPGHCGLHMHERPNADAPRVGETLPDGTHVYVVCQTAGARATAVNGASSVVWDRLANGGWVSDLWVETPSRGRFSKGVERC